jgi:ribonuclease P protein component
MDNTFSKAERIHHKKEINHLFEHGNKLFSHPYRVNWLLVERKEDNPAVQILISVSKRKFKKAVDRNHVKRYIRESYRTQKEILWKCLDHSNQQLQLAIIYVNKDIGDYDEHHKNISKLLHKLSKVVLNP